MDYAPETADDITDEIVDMAVEIVDGWYQNTRVDWEDVLERLDRQTLSDGRGLDFGESMTSPAIRCLQRRVRKAIREG
ncbi:hypothetical protein [Streptomyces sp. NPDC048643]|uniref:hypothetical protein n=1 Tax=Streptomyces sp. NPDC048643 TaxID=3155637 RepID=UPI0034435374